MDRSDTEVLVVGAGPCGLMLTNELGQRGIDVLCVDREPGVATAPQANATQARTMEHYRRLGFAHELRALGLPPDYPTDVAYFTTFTGHELARHEQPAAADAGARIRELQHIWNGAELPHRVAQSIVECKLCEKAQEHPSVEVAFSHAVTGFDEEADGVTVTIESVDTGESREVRCRYLFGADGSSSKVREQLGIRYAGAGGAPRDFMGGRMLSVYLDAPAFYDVVQAPRAWMYWCFNRRRRALLAATNGRGQFVLQTQLRPGEDHETMSDADAVALFHQALGAEIPVEVTGIATWIAGRGLVAERFGRGRVLLGGDAVHIFTPTGGMGYNTAIEDAVNAGWKLAAVLRGQADPALLDSYEAERRPVALRNTAFALGFADSVGLYVPSPAIEAESTAGEAARARAGAYLAQHAAREFTIPGFTFGARYDGSPAIVDDGAPTPPDAPSVYVPSAKPGGRAPHVWLADGASLFDRFGFGWTLLRLGDEGGAEKESDRGTEAAMRAEAQRRGIDLTVLDLSDEPVARDLYERPFSLIRPDQIVAWRGDSATDAEAATVFGTVTGHRGTEAVP